MTTWAMGDHTIHLVPETAQPAAIGAWLLPDATAPIVAGVDWLRPDYADAAGGLRLDSHSFAVALGDLRVVVDTGIGNHKQRANPAWHDLHTDYLDRLTAAGFAPDEVDLVVHTHLHADHVGWNTRLEGDQWVPTFPHARHVVTRTEREFWAGHAMEPARAQMFDDSVLPIERAGMLDLVDVEVGGLDLVEGLRLVPTPGHTPGHVAVQLTGGGCTALITGDCLHHPVQLAHPDIGACVDIDPVLAHQTRARMLAEVAGTDTLLLGTHFPPPVAGRVIKEAGGYRLVPVPGGESPPRPEEDRRSATMMR